MNDDPALNEYIAKREASGVGLEVIYGELVGAGWPKSLVDHAISSYKIGKIPAPEPGVETPFVTEELVEDPKKPRKKGVGVLGVVAAIMLFVGVSVGLAGVYFYLNPNKVMGWSMGRMADAGSVRFIGKVKLMVNGLPAGSLTGLLMGEEASDEEKAKMRELGTLSMEGEMTWEGEDLRSKAKSEVSTTFLGPGKISYEFETISVDDYLYLYQGEGGGFLGTNADADWVRYDRNYVSQFSKDAKVQPKSSELTEKQKEEVAKLVKQYPPIQAKRLEGVERQRGVPVVKMSISLDKENTLKLLEGLVTVVPDLLEKDDTDVAKALETIEIKGFAWVGITDGRVHKFVINFENNIDEVKVAGEFEWEFYDFGFDGQIEEPTDFVDLAELMKKQMEAYSNNENMANLYGGQFEAARDAQRRADLYSITNGIYQYAAEHNGNLPGNIPTVETEMGTGPGMVDLGSSLVPAYLPSIPFDPSKGKPDATGYTIIRDVSGKLTVSAVSEIDPGAAITVTR